MEKNISHYSKELKKFVEKFKKPIRFEKEPIEYSSKNGKPIKFKKIPVYAEEHDKRVALKGSFSPDQHVSKGLEKELLKIWKPIIINSKFLIYPVDESRDGYDVRFYQIKEYISLQE
jgi:hypothetical protein